MRPWGSARPKIRSYVDFDLRVERNGDRYRARARCPLAGEGVHLFDAPFSPADLATFERHLRAASRGARLLEGGEPFNLRDFGGRLFGAVLGGDVLVCWRTGLSHLAGRGLRLRLRTNDAEVAAWPWEILHDPREGFLATSERTPVVRYEEIPGALPSLTGPPPLRILVLGPAPIDEDPLEIEQECLRLQGVLAPLVGDGRVVLDRVEPPTRYALEQRLVLEACDVLHVIGHGRFEPGKDAVVLLETGERRTDPVSGTSLATMLVNNEPPRLVVLNLCDGGRVSPTDSFVGLAQALVRKGIPAVVAMREPISDHAALAFSRGFYQRLASGAPIEAAVSRARLEMEAAGCGNEWGTPVLYSRAADTILPPARFPWTGVLLVLGLLGALAGFALLKDRTPQPPQRSALAVPLPPLAASDRRCPSLPGLQLPFAYIDRGSFEMGEGRHARRVEVPRPFCIGKYEVTEAQWDAVMGDSTHGQVGASERQPAVEKSAQDADRFVVALSARFPVAGVRLPSEKEWEYAARGGSHTRYSFGDNVALLHRYSNCEGPADGFPKVAPIGALKPNVWDLYDMQGNVWEWVAPDDGPPAARRIRRGGSFDIVGDRCTVTSQKEAVADWHRSDVGFRIVAEPLPPDRAGDGVPVDLEPDREGVARGPGPTAARTTTC